MQLPKLQTIPLRTMHMRRVGETMKQTEKPLFGDELVVLGDARELIKEIPNEAFLISDPPYNQGYHYSQYKDSLKEKEYQNLLFDVFHGRKAVIILYPEQIINLLGAGLLGRCEEVVAWVYNSNTAKQHRLVTWWNCKPDFRRIGQQYKNPTDKRIAKRIAEGKKARLYDWWEINQVKNVSKKHTHPCPIPAELARRIILITTQPGDLVVDPFCGVGTILRAAKETNRNCVGFEIDANYYKEARNNLWNFYTAPIEPPITNSPNNEVPTCMNTTYEQ